MLTYMLDGKMWWITPQANLPYELLLVELLSRSG
jgi:hypothetical protein